MAPIPMQGDDFQRRNGRKDGGEERRGGSRVARVLGEEEATKQGGVELLL